MFLLLNPPQAEAPAVASYLVARKTGKPLKKVLPLRFKKTTQRAS